MLLGLQGLVQPVAVAPARHHPACELVDDDDLPLLDEVVHVPPEEGVGAQGLVDVVEELDVPRLVEVLHLEDRLHPGHPLLGQDDRALFSSTL